ncbi:MAG: efflux RND transporter permease subunit [Planctomycetaceae bacterium]|nr:efflux RND transporter permease subunit [Planctomycetaceae bacterium]
MTLRLHLSTTFTIFLVAVGAAIGAARCAEPAAAKVDFAAFLSPDGYFRCDVPRDWGRVVDEHEESRMHYRGVYLVGPRGDEPIEPTLSARYFSPDNTLGDTAEKYLRRQLKPGIVQLEGEKTSAPEETQVDGRRAVKFTRDTFDFFPPDSIDAKRIAIREECYVLPHLTGFVVIRYGAPTAAFAQHRPVLERLLESFRLLPEQALVVVRAKIAGASAADLDAKVAEPLEKELAGIPEAAEARAVSRRGESVVELTLKHGADPADCRRGVQQRLAALEGRLPPGTQFELEPALAADGPALLIALYSDEETNSPAEQVDELAALAERTVRTRAATVPGIAKVARVGVGRRVDVVPSAERMLRRDVGLDDILTAVHKCRGSVAELKQTIVAVRDGEPTRLEDVAEVRLDAERSHVARLWLRDPTQDRPIAPAAALFIVQAASDVDAPAAFRAVEQLLDDLVATLPRHARLAYQVFGAEDVGLTIRLPGGNAQATAAAVEAAASGLLGAAEIRSIWRVDDGDDQAELWISLGSVTAKRRPEISARLREQVKAQNRAAEIAVDFGPTRSALPRIGSPFTVTLSGTDLTTLLDQAAAVRERLNAVPGVADLVTYPATATPYLRCVVDPDRAARYRIDPEQVAAAAAQVIEPRTVGQVVGPHDLSLDVAVVLPGDEPSAAASLPIHAPAGMLVPLGQLAEITVSSEPSAVLRQAGRRVVVLGASAVDDPAAVFARVRAACDEIKLPAGIAITFSDERSTQ